MHERAGPTDSPGGAGADPPSLQALVDARHEFLAFLERRVGDRATAEDVLQDAFAKASGRIVQLRDDESAAAWFYRVLRNAVVDHHRRRGVETRALEALSRELGEPEAPGDLRDAVCGCVTRLAATLKPEYSEALRRIEVEGTAVKDFAAERGLTATNAGVRVHRARQALRDLVIQSCRGCADQQCRDCDCVGP